MSSFKEEQIKKNFNCHQPCVLAFAAQVWRCGD